MKTLNYFVGEFAWFNGFETDSEASIKAYDLALLVLFETNLK
jgi:hypothetical protein